MIKKIILLIFLPAALSGCGTFGDISDFKIKYDDKPALPAAVAVAPFTMDEHAGINQNIGAYNMGRFNGYDLKKIETSLKNTLLQFDQPASDSPYVVHVHFQRYIMVYSNIRGTILALADWCLEKEGKILHQEISYAAFDSGEFPMGTLGGAKTKINKAIVRQIIEQTLARIVPDYQAKPVELIYPNLESALAILPTGVGGSEGAANNATGLAAGVFAIAISSKEYGNQTAYAAESIITPIDWESRIKQ
jgi:hypothetical protein